MVWSFRGLWLASVFADAHGPETADIHREQAEYTVLHMEPQGPRANGNRDYPRGRDARVNIPGVNQCFGSGGRRHNPGQEEVRRV